MTVKRGKNFLMAPGPTNVPDRVLAAMHRPAVELSDPAFIGLVRSCLADLRPIFKTQGEIFIYAANGHGAWEAALANTLSPGDLVLAPETGHFSASWSRMAESLGARADLVPSDWRHAVDPGRVEERLREDTEGRIKAVLMVQTDTATSITSDVAAVREAIDAAGHPALYMVDAVASLGTTDFRMDEWKIDVGVGASQKALMTPPGLSFCAVGPRALAAARETTLPRDYWDWHKRLAGESYTWFCGTAPEHLLFALREAIDMVQEEGLDAMFARHQRLADAVRAAIATWSEAGAVELNALVPAEAANSVSTIRVAEGYDAVAVRETCRERFDVSLGGGLGRFQGKAFRIGHMGDINEPMILGALASVEAALAVCGVPHGEGGVVAAIDYLAERTKPVGSRAPTAPRDGGG